MHLYEFFVTNDMSLFGAIAVLSMPGLFVLFILLLMSVKVVMQYQRAVLFRFGKYKGTLEPGLRFIIPFIDSAKFVDMRITTVDIPKQGTITKDNVPVAADGVVYFKVIDPRAAIVDIKDFRYAVAQYAQTALRDIIGGVELDDLLAKRDEIAAKLKALVDKETDAWGVDITAVKLQDVELPGDMKRAMAREAEAEREKRANIINASGEVIAAKNLAKAAQLLEKNPAGLHLRTLQTIADVSADQSNTIFFTLPLEVMGAFKKMAGKK